MLIKAQWHKTTSLKYGYPSNTDIIIRIYPPGLTAKYGAWPVSGWPVIPVWPGIGIFPHINYPDILFPWLRVSTSYRLYLLCTPANA